MLRSRFEAGSNDAATPLGSSRRARASSVVVLVAALAFASIALSSAAVADQLPVLRFGAQGSAAGQMKSPGGVAVDQASGDVYVADTGNNRIDEFGPEGSFVRAWGWGVEDGSDELQTCEATCEFGLPGKGAGEFNGVIGVAVSPADGDVYTVNRRDGRIQRFTATGAFVEQFGGYGAEPDEFGTELANFNDIGVDSDGNVYVGDSGKGRIAVFDSSGAFASEISTEVGPLVVAPNDDLYVAGFGEMVHIFGPGGTLEGELSMHESFGAKALAINPANGNLLAEVTSGFAATLTYAMKEIDPAGTLVSTTPLALTPPPESNFEEQSFGLAAGATAAFPESEPGAIYAADLRADEILALAEGTPGEPRIGGTRVSSLGIEYADLGAAIDPVGLATKYTFEYGPTAAYGHSSPAAPATVAPGFESVSVGAHLTGLAPGATYHYNLIASNADGTVESGDHSFTTYPVGGPTALPDGRAYELVTPLEKGNNDAEPRSGIEMHGVAGGDEAGMSYVTINGLPGSKAGALLVASVAKRGATGWSSTTASGPELNQTTLATGAPIMLSADLTKALIYSKVDLTGTAGPGPHVYIHTLSPSGYQLVTAQSTGLFPLEGSNAVGASNDFSRVFFQTDESLTSDSPKTIFRPNLYEWDGTQLRNVGILPGQTAPVAEGVTTFGPELDPVSEDGADVIFDAEPEPSTPAQVYRRAGGQTIRISTPNPGVKDPAGPREATFVGAAANGSSVFFTSAATLTEDADTGENGSGETDLAPNLYRWDAATGELTDLTVDESGDELGAAVGRVVVAGDGNAAYFVAGGELAPGATPGSPNLYRWSQGAGVSFIATVSPSDGIASGFPSLETATNASGNAVAFTSQAGLAGHGDAAGVAEIYHWSPSEGLACASCGQGLIGTGATLPPPGLKRGSGGGHPLSADGRKVFFTTSDALVAADTNAMQDAYEWEGGTDSLLSTGSGNSNSYFVDASPSGKDVFFATREHLVPADDDENIDVYDAREGGGFPVAAAEPAPCEAEACRPSLTAAPAPPQLGSSSFDGPGNLKPKKKPHKKPAHKKPAHKKKQQAKKCVTGKGKSKTKQCRKRNSHKAHSGGKRG
ncbi:MAG TPA: NHL repeat-containing protein [Solirubrobacterales bacterium]